MHTCGLDIEYDPRKAIANVRKHPVDFGHAEQKLRDPMATTIEDPDTKARKASKGELEQYDA